MRSIDVAHTTGLRRDLPPFRTGDTVRVHVKIREGEKERIQVFEGVVIRRKQGGHSATFTVRKVSYGVGVERVFPIESPAVTKVEIKRRGHVRRARLYYLRELRGKKARLRSKVRDLSGLISEEEAEAAMAGTAAAVAELEAEQEDEGSAEITEEVPAAGEATEEVEAAPAAEQPAEEAGEPEAEKSE